MWLPDWNSVGNNLVADTIVIVAMSASVRAAIGRVARITFDRGQEVAFWLLIPTVLALGLIALRLNAPPIAALVTERSEWPAFTKQEIAEWADALRPFPIPVVLGCSYSSEQDQEFLAGILAVAREVNWLNGGAGMAGVTSGIQLEVAKDREEAARELQTLLEKKTKTHVSLKIIPGWTAQIQIYVGRKPPT